jgi:hypothetical protein
MNTPFSPVILAGVLTLGTVSALGQGAFGGNGINGQRAGGISFVTRRVPMAVPNQIAGGFFASGGVPVGGAYGGGAPGGAPGGQQLGAFRLAQAGPRVSGESTEVAEASLTPEARRSLQNLARTGNVEARAVLTEFSPAEAPVSPDPE